MHVVLAVGDAELEVEVNHGRDATVADALTALAGGPVARGTALAVDGRLADPRDPLGQAGIRPGAILRLGPPGTVATVDAQPAPLELRLVGGLPSGTRFPLRPGRFVLGRATDADLVIDAPTVSTRHAYVEVTTSGTCTIADVGSCNGTRVEGEFVLDPAPLRHGQLIEIGAVQALVVDRPPVAKAGTAVSGCGTTTFNRPPRPAPPPPAPPLQVPARRAERTERSHFGWAGVLVPVALGAAMALLWDPRMAAFALFSPVMMIASWLEDRRRSRRERAEGQARLSAELERFRTTLLDARGTELERRRATLPDLGEVVARATHCTSRLWERRPAHRDFLLLRAGTGTVEWRAPLEASPERPAEVDAVLSDLAALERAPVEVDVSAGHTLGLVGPRTVVAAFLRALVCQAAALHGPADLRIAVLTEPGRVADWDWVKWLPHTSTLDGASGRTLLGAEPPDVEEILVALLESAPDADQRRPSLASAPTPAGPVTLVVVDADGLTEGRDSSARRLLSGRGRPAAGIVVAPTIERLPALCTTVVELDGPDGLARITEPGTGRRVDDVLVNGATEEVARSCARSLAGVDDPELAGSAAWLPDTVSLLGLLDMPSPTADAVLARWRTAAAVPGLLATVGATEQGPLVLDLVADGPHALVGGTTGSGKSELLRTLVASLACTVDPDHLTFVLVDYKGGSAFDVCARLPHTVGLVTDLDEHLGERALRCLEAELRYRERVLREAGAADLPELLARDEGDTLPRLVVVIDEFATMAAELPDFVDALVGIAQRGRSLGVHLILATQRPSGAVNDNIRANTNLRVALRVQDAGDSNDVLGCAVAASVGRRQAGRGYVRLGPGEIVPFQAGLVTGTSSSSPGRHVDVRPFRFGGEPDAAAPGAALAATAHAGDDVPSDLARLVDAVAAAFVSIGRPAPRRPWPEPLAEHLVLDDLGGVQPPSTAAWPAAPIGLVDDPSRQCQSPLWWDGTRGNLLLYGVAGSGTTTALGTLAVALARRHPPDRLHLYALDFGAGGLAPIAALPHTGAVIGAAERERQVRLVRHLRTELDRRRQPGAGAAPVEGTAAADPTVRDGRVPTAIVLLLDGYGGFLAAFDDLVGMTVRDELARVIADGPGVGIWVVASADHLGAVPSTVAALVPEKLLFRLADRHDYATFGIPARSVPDLPAGRGLDSATGLEVQIALPGTAGLAAAVEAVHTGDPSARVAPDIGVLPTNVALATVEHHARIEDGDWLVSIGMCDSDLRPGGLRLRHGDHALVAGGPRSGKSSALRSVATVVASHRRDVEITAIALRTSLVSEAPGLTSLVTSCADLRRVAEELIEASGPQLVLIDDADIIDDADGALSRLFASRRADLHVVAAGRADVLRSAYGHWTREVRRSRIGLALRPDPDDGDLWQVAFPRRAQPAPLPGRGYLVADGAAELFQVARP